MTRTKIILLHLSLALGLNLSVFSQTEKTVILNPNSPLPGQKLEVKYNAKESPLGDANDIKGVVYMFCNYEWTTKDLILSPDGGYWKGLLDIPSDCGFLAFKFESHDKVDNNNNKGYAWLLKKADQTIMPGAYAGWGLMRSPEYGYSIPCYSELNKSAVSDTVTYYWLNQEITRTPASAGPMAVLLAQSLKKAHINGAEQRMKRIVAFLLKNESEENLLKATYIYKNLLGLNQSADSLTQVMLTRYPKGSIARLNAYRAANNQKSGDEKRQALIQFVKDFPELPADAKFNDDNRISYGNVYQTIIILDVINKNYSSIKTYLEQLPMDASINLFYKVIEIPHNRKDMSDQELYPYAKLLVDHLENTKDIKPLRYYHLSPNEWNGIWNGLFAKNILITYVDILKNNGKNKEALSYAQLAQRTLQYTKADLNGNMAILLNDNGDQELLKTLLMKSLYNNQINSLMLDLLKKEYIAEHKSEAGFDAFIKAHKNPALAVNESKFLVESKREGVMPAWSMMDAEGKLIDSNSLKGKTYVLDFWASWCVPCKASFPGMKLAVEKYKNDPNVQFYFVDTEERSENYKEAAKKYIKDNNYPFHILFDNKLKGKEINDEVFSRIAKAFTISGIPQKIFVDKNGHVQYISVGYKGSPSELADEISGMVEQTKNVK